WAPTGHRKDGICRTPSCHFFVVPSVSSECVSTDLAAVIDITTSDCALSVQVLMGAMLTYTLVSLPRNPQLLLGSIYTSKGVRKFSAYVDHFFLRHAFTSPPLGCGPTP